LIQAVLSRRTHLRVTFTVGVLAVAGWIAWGPLLPWSVEGVRSAPGTEAAAGRLYLCSQAQTKLLRSSEASETLELWLSLYAREAGRDWDPLMSGESKWIWPKYEMRDGLVEQGFAPWAYQRGASAPACQVSESLLGQVLLDYADLLEGAKEYPKAAHVLICVLNLWPEGSEVHARALKHYMQTVPGRRF